MGGAVSDLFCSVTAWVVEDLPVFHTEPLATMRWFLTFTLGFGPLAGGWSRDSHSCSCVSLKKKKNLWMIAHVWLLTQVKRILPSALQADVWIWNRSEK